MSWWTRRDCLWKPASTARRSPTRTASVVSSIRPVRGWVAFSYLWVDAGYRGRGKEWVEQELGVEVEVVNRSPKPPPEKVLRIWAREWFKDGREMDLKKLPERPAFENLPRRWVAERTFGGSPTTGAWTKTTSVSARRARPSCTRR